MTIPILFRPRSKRQAIFSAILSSPGISARKINNLLHANDPSGGPCDQSIQMQIHYMKPTLARNEYILDTRLGPGGGYTLRTQEPAQ